MSAILIPTAGEAEWLEARRQGITASEIAVVMGLSPYSSPFALYHAKLGQLPQQADNVEMELGRFLEEFVCRKFGDRRPEFWQAGDGRQLYRREDRPWQLATPDRLLFERPPEWLGIPDSQLGAGLPDVCAVLETKTDAGYDGWGEDGSDEIPVHYRCQVLWQMDVMGVTAGFVACLFLHSRQLRVYELTMDEQAKDDLLLMRIEALRFHDRVLGRGEPPDIDWRPATRDALKHLHPSLEDRDVPVRRQLAISYAAAVRRYKAAERRKDEMTNRVLHTIGSGRRAVDERTGDVIATRQVYDQKEYVRKACTVNKLVAPRAKKEPAS